MQRVLLFLKGVCMGVSDIIPGVSGGTMALILGIYAELVHTIKGLHLRWLPALWRWIRGGFRPEDGREVLEAWRSMNLGFLAVLGVGILVAVGIGGMILPGLLERYPEAMRALFFGLIVASVGIPFRMLDSRGRKTVWAVATAAVVGISAGWFATAPDRVQEMGISWTELEADEGETLEDLSRRGPAAWTGEQIYWADENAELRAALEARGTSPDVERPGTGAVQDPERAEKRSEVYRSLEIPEGTPVQIPQPALWYVFVAGLVAICAMILPGVSGSYILLILGAYFFVLNSLRGALTGLAELSLPVTPLLFVAAFGTGAVIGILSFARVMSHLLRKYRAPTVGLLAGLMVGCLRGIWPFREVVDGQMVNVVPGSFDGTVAASLAAAVAGMIAVGALSRLGKESPGDSGAGPPVDGNTEGAGD